MEMRSRLPVGVAAFVGRERERASLAELIADARVVTLTGAGGCGKTRLALEVAGDVASRFTDGTWWVDLQGVNDPTMVAATVAAAMGVREQPEQVLTDALTQQLRDRHLLIVLDNCEHLVERCAALVTEVSSRCPQLHVLATSRVPLAVQGEVTFGVGPLPVPTPHAKSSAAVASTDAARLFEVRARQVHPEFRIDDDNAVAVAEICRHLDGIPLAIELAAARTRVLSPTQIAEGLSDRFRLLTGGARGAPARQLTLEASLDWSYHLLDERHRLALARLSVFAGSFELDAAEAVVAGDDIDGGEVLDLVAGLVTQSLLQVVHAQGSARYRMLETIRLYARQRLAELDDPDQLRDRHLAFHRELAARAKAGLNAAHPDEWMARLTADLDDLRAAMSWAASRHDVRGLADLTEPIVRFWFGRGLSAEVYRRLLDASERGGTATDDRVRSLVTATALAGDSGAFATAYRAASQAVDAARAADERGQLAVALGLRAFMGVLSGQPTCEQLETDAEEATQLAEQCEDAATRAYAMQNAGGTLLFGRTIDGGRRQLEQVVTVCESNQLAFQLPAVHAALGLWPVLDGRLDQARRHARLAVELSQQVERPGWEVVGLIGMGAADVVGGDHDDAAKWLSQAQEVLRRRGLEGAQYELSLRPWLALSAYASGDPETAGAEAAGLLELGRAGGSGWAEAMGDWLLGMIASAEGHHDDARAHLEASRERSRRSCLRFQLGRSLLGLGALAGHDDDLDAAWELAHDALEILDEYGDRLGTAEALEVIAGLALAADEPERSLRLLAASERFHAESGIARFPAAGDRFAHARDTARAALDETDSAASWEAGRQLSLAEAVAYARRGRGQRQRPRIGWGSLTPAERDVVRLVAAGHTNAEIGDRLFMSVNTVKKHLSHVYAKVDVAGRADLAAEVARRDL
jgi:predicted ATPase/DNA-binding CsgD family transcriptional regulator